MRARNSASAGALRSKEFAPHLQPEGRGAGSQRSNRVNQAAILLQPAVISEDGATRVVLCRICSDH